jgi:hypothetical protein
LGESELDVSKKTITPHVSNPHGYGNHLLKRL